MNLIKINSKNFSMPLICFILLFLSLQHSVKAQNVLKAEDVTKIKSVTIVAISDNSRYVAYTLSVPADPLKENSPSITQLHILNTETEETIPFYTTASVGNIAFRPQQNTVTFLTRREGDSARSLYEMPLSGGEAIKLFEHKTNILSYEWRNDGNHIVYTAFEQTEDSQSHLPYSSIVFEENQPNRRAFITNVQVSGHQPHELPVQGSIYNMTWSPDGSKIALSAAPTPTVDDQFMAQKIFIVDYPQREISAEINNEGKLGQIVWSPNGQRLAIRAGQDIHDPIDGRILIVSASGGTPQIIDRDFQGKYEQISWPEANTIHFIASEGVWSTYGTIRPDGSNKQRIIEPGGPILSSYSRAENGSVAFHANTSNHPNEVYFMTRRGRDLKQFTNHNEWLNEVELGRQELIRHQARDGAFEIEGLLIYPVGYQQGDKVPLIAQVHGGPEAHYSNGWLTSYSMPGQMAAGKGYAVFYSNYRGSTGRGIEFIYSSQGDLAGKEFDDIVDGVDYLIDQGIADENRIGVTGGSYGGYASAWMSTYYSDRFAAAVMFVGISNNISKWGTSDIPEELYLVHSRKRLWDHWQWNLERSPIFYVDRSQTPILIMHGAEDTRVHPAQSLELHRHLKVRKPEVPLRLVLFPEEGHGNTRASSRYEYTLRMLRWFDTYLMTGDRSAEIPHWDIPVNK
ncbi:MAG: S9 family peptidase [Balneolaceae bacterium]